MLKRAVCFLLMLSLFLSVNTYAKDINQELIEHFFDNMILAVKACLIFNFQSSETEFIILHCSLSFLVKNTLYANMRRMIVDINCALTIAVNPNPLYINPMAVLRYIICPSIVIC